MADRLYCTRTNCGHPVAWHDANGCTAVAFEHGDPSLEGVACPCQRPVDEARAKATT